MLRRIDPVAATIAQACRGLADAGAVGTMHRPAREPGQQRALDLLLQIEHQIVTIADQYAAESRGFTPGRAVEDLVPPATQRDRDDAIDTAMHGEQRRKSFLGDPVDRDAGTMSPDVVHDRQSMHDVAERRWSDDQHAAHRMRLTRIAADDAACALLAAGRRMTCRCVARRMGRPPSHAASETLLPRRPTRCPIFSPACPCLN